MRCHPASLNPASVLAPPEIVEKAAYPAAVDKRPLGATLATGMPLAPSPGPNGGVADSLEGRGGKALVLFIVVGLLPPNGG